MQPVVVGERGTDWTNAPRALTEDETAKIKAVSFIDGVKLHRQLTNSTLSAATRAVRELRDNA